MTEEESQSRKENIHYATDPKQCEKMGKLNNWPLRRVEKSRDPILEAKCIFEGEQTTFMEDD